MSVLGLAQPSEETSSTADVHAWQQKQLIPILAVAPSWAITDTTVRVKLVQQTPQSRPGSPEFSHFSIVVSLLHVQA
jgi:hypothetical protein